MEDEKKQKKQKFQLKELFTNKQYRSILILAFYVILFIVLITSIRSPKLLSNNESSNYQTFPGYELIHNNNFAYTYTVTLDEEIIYYEGKKSDDKEILKIYNDSHEEEYYFDSNQAYRNDDGHYIKEIKPYFIFDFFDTKVVEALIKRGTMIENEEGTFLLDNQDLYDVLNNDNKEVENGDNFMTLSYRNSYIIGIVFDLSNYSKAIEDSYDKVIVSLEYRDFNLIEEIVVDID